jgi:hypothetical protein
MFLTDVEVCWLIDYLLFYVPLKNISLIWRRHHCRWRAAKFRPMLGSQGLWAGRDLYRATPAATRDLGFSGLFRRTAPFSRLLQHTRGCGGSILTRILTGFEVCWSMFNNKVIKYIQRVHVYYELKRYLEKEIISSNEAIIVFGSRRYWWVGRKGKTKFYFRPTCIVDKNSISKLAVFKYLFVHVCHKNGI